jgi:uncharacterized protein YyaL (SSP411 family)
LPEARKPNRLANEKSPYLLKHSLNPVDWFSWNKEALAKAKNDNKPIFLSIGYSTCHWCHRMRDESFENEKTAAFINKNFIPIKVDREERPEVDAYYMGAVQAMTGSGGWPLSVFLTPDLKAFYGGTYFPPEPRYGMPSFMQVLEFAANLWKDRRDEVMANSENVLKTIAPETKHGVSVLSKSALDEGYSTLAASFDPEHGGFGGAPKFPLPGSLGFLLRYYYREGKEMALKTVLTTLDEIAAGGIRDHVGGGFHRYSTDRVWLVPHFEKMLYDNALLAKLYAEAYLITRKAEYADVLRETLNWITGEMKGDSGGFYSAQDADTTEGEGNYYTWTPEEVEKVLGRSDASVFCGIYGITRTGNFEGRTILHQKPGSSVEEGMAEDVRRSKRALYEARVRRPRPATDTKVLTSWNGLAISALAFSSRVLKDDRYSKEAASAARFVLKEITKDGQLLRRYAGGESALEGTLEDYAYFIQGLLDLFEATSEVTWLRESIRLSGVMLDDFEDGADGGLYLTREAVPARLKESYDGPTPSGNSVAALDFIRLAELTGDEKFRQAAERTLKYFGKEIESQPSGHTSMLVALDMLLNGVREIVITSPTKRMSEGMKAEVFRTFIPDKVVLTATGETFDDLEELTSLLEGRKPADRARAFVCQNFTCKLPADSVEALRAQLEAPKG